MTKHVCSRRSAVAALLAAAPAAAALGGAPSILYHLTDGSAYSEGCGVPGQNSPCDCAVLLTGDIQGIFNVSEVPPPGDLQTFAIEGVHWTVTLFGTTFEVTGSGLYQRG